VRPIRAVPFDGVHHEAPVLGRVFRETRVSIHMVLSEHDPGRPLLRVRTRDSGEAADRAQLGACFRRQAREEPIDIARLQGLNNACAASLGGAATASGAGSIRLFTRSNTPTATITSSQLNGLRAILRLARRSTRTAICAGLGSQLTVAAACIAAPPRCW
jgi:hypothetical protein